MKTSPTTARLAGILIAWLLAVLVSPSPTLADHEGSQFDLISARSNRSSQWSTRGCTNDDDQDDGCYVKISAESDLREKLRTEYDKTEVTSWEQAWKNLFTNLCHNGHDEVDNDDDYDEQNKAFNDCWEDDGGNVEWPIVEPSEDFEATGFCKSGHHVCAISIEICYNADECDGSRNTNDEFDTDDGAQAEFWDDNNSCLYDVSSSRFTECVNRGLKRVYDQLAKRGRFGYTNLQAKLEQQGVAIDGYSTSLSDVENRNYFKNTYYTHSHVHPKPAPVYHTHHPKPAPVYHTHPPKPVPPVYHHPPAQPRYSGTLHYDAVYVNYSGYLDTALGSGECNTTQGCIRVIGSGYGLSNHLGRVFIQITDRKIRSCLSAHGIPYHGPTVVEFDDPVLKACDTRIATANGVCPARGIGIKEELLRMYHLGLLQGLLSPAHAQVLQQEVNAARFQAADCLCRSGFRNRHFVSVATGDPWNYHADPRQPLLCRS